MDDVAVEVLMQHFSLVEVLWFVQAREEVRNMGGPDTVRDLECAPTVLVPGE